MTIRTEDMHQEATYWAPGTPDGFGGVDFSAITPTLIDCRWQNDAELFRDTEGREVMSHAIVYPSVLVELRGILALGDYVSAGTAIPDPRDVAGAYEIRKVGQSPSLQADEILVKVWL